MFNKIWENTITRRIFVVVFSSLAILGTAASCSLPGSAENVYGVLKRDPAIRNDGFVKANAVQTLSGEVNGQGLTPVSAIKIYQVPESNTLYLLTKDKGLFRSEDGGVLWNRLYVLPLGDDQETGIRENDNLDIVDFDVDRNLGQVIYVAAVKDGTSKIYQSLDAGQNFSEIYTEIQDRDDIGLIRVDPVNTTNIFAIIEEGALLKSADGGITWQKVRSFRDQPVDMGFVPEFDQAFYVLFEDEGLAISRDGGINFELAELNRSESQIGERQPTDSLDINFEENTTFGKYEKIVPVTADIEFDYEQLRVTRTTGKQPWILIADRQMWYSEDVDEPFRKLILPSQAEQYDLYDVAPDPQAGLGRIYVSIDSNLFITNNRGQSWDTREKLNIDGELGNIGQILIDDRNSEIIYLTVLDKRARRNSGFFIF
jgi:hypothetical protein